MKRIYMAGKISKNGWRHQLIERENEWRLLRNAAGPFDFRVGGHQLQYIGPFFEACDHGCFHEGGQHNHAVLGPTYCCESQGVGIAATSAALEGVDFEPTRAGVKGASLGLIAFHCDLLFAHIDDYTCYGTLVELGWAQAVMARKKEPLQMQVNFATPELKDEMWFSHIPLWDGHAPATVNLDPHSALTSWLDSLVPDTRSYAEKLQDVRWQKMRLEILQRDGWRCTNCGRNSQVSLHVHHLRYRKGAAPWEYDLAELVTLCADCHAAEHRN